MKNDDSAILIHPLDIYSMTLQDRACKANEQEKRILYTQNIDTKDNCWAYI